MITILSKVLKDFGDELVYKVRFDYDGRIGWCWIDVDRGLVDDPDIDLVLGECIRGWANER